MSAASKEEKPEGKDLLADLQDISDSERKTSTAESSLGNGGVNCTLRNKAEIMLLHYMIHTVDWQEVYKVFKMGMERII